MRASLLLQCAVAATAVATAAAAATTVAATATPTTVATVNPQLVTPAPPVEDPRHVAISTICFLVAVFVAVVVIGVAHSLRRSTALRGALILDSDDEDDVMDRRTWRNPVTNHVLEVSGDDEETEDEEESGDEDEDSGEDDEDEDEDDE